MNEKLFKETLSRVRASRESKEEISIMAEKSRHVSRRVLLAAAVAAAVLCALTVSALATGKYLGGWRDEDMQVVHEYIAVTDGTDRGFIIPDDTPEDTTDNAVSLPRFRMNNSVTVEDERVILRLNLYKGSKTVFSLEQDITDELASSPDGTYSYYNEDRRDGTEWIYDITVKPGWESKYAEENGNGYGYVITGTRYVYCRHDVGKTIVTLYGDAWQDDTMSWNPYCEQVPQTWSRD